jgi:hypothetical protein
MALTLRLFGIALFPFTVSLFVAVSGVQGAVASPLPFGYEVYSETYRDYTSHNIIEFQRLSADLSTTSLDTLTAPIGGKTKYYSALIHERYDIKSLYSAEVGLQKELVTNWSAQVTARVINLNDDAFRDIQGRAGVFGGWAHPVYSNWLYFESYAELFALLPGKSNLQLAGSGFASIAYRAYEAHYWILDPALLEARVYRASNPEYAGRGYGAINLGPKAAYWWKTDNGFGSAGLFIAKSLVWSPNGNALNDNWFLLTIGARF